MNDEDANVYVAMDGQGRIMVFNPLAFPVVPAAWSRRRPQSSFNIHGYSTWHGRAADFLQ
jgi:hypothetical protein